LVLTATGQSFASEAIDWLINRSLPLWMSEGVDHRNGGFFDRLDPRTAKNSADIKRLRVSGRQIYVFCQAAKLGQPEATGLVRHGVEQLLGPFRHAEGGFVSRISLDGRVLDSRRDLYDNAFALFGLAHAYALLGDPMLRDEARALIAYLNTALRHPAGGFLESCQGGLPRRQNPHMHLLEAALAWMDIGPDTVPECAELAGHLVALYARHFVVGEEGLIAEYFRDDWSVDQPRGEAGHHLEWVWLLSEYTRITGAAVPLARLKDCALKYGIHPETRLLHGEFDLNGRVTEPGSRLWPHAEWVRAETVGDGSLLAVAWSALRRFLDHPTPGLWFERQTPQHGFVLEEVPASSLYHITGAVMALRGRQVET
jgi:mannose-6-phosphate isomerase